MGSMEGRTALIVALRPRPQRSATNAGLVLSAVPLWGGVQSQTEDTLTAMGVVRCFKRHSLPGPPAQAGPVRCIILPYLRYYRTYAYTYNIICNVLSGTDWHAVYRLRNVR